jgi:tRNA-binding protein
MAMEPTQPQTTPTTTPTINFDDFAKLDLRVATVLECKPHENADKLLVLQIELANGERRQICAGVRAYYPPEQLVGKQIVVVANLEPRKMRGEVSQGMLLAATDTATGKVIVVSPSEPAAPGSKVS